MKIMNFEEQLGSIHVHKAHSVTLTDTIKDMLTRMFPLNKCKRQDIIAQLIYVGPS